VLGVLGEADRLSDAERERVVGIAVEAAAGRLAVTVGVTHPSTRVAVERARAAEAAGAAAVMVSPPALSREHFARVRDAVGCTLVVQDYPVASGVRMPVDFLASLGEVVVKLEDPPTPPKIAALREAAPTIGILGGLGGVAVLQELEAGSDGTMTGFAFPESLVEIVTAHRAGDAGRARAAWERALPLLVFEAQPGAGVALRKEILRRRGAIEHATVRSPAAAPPAQTLAELDALLAARAL
jgi:4-hydroxy-tetrahydrodipicolinate synthase